MAELSDEVAEFLSAGTCTAMLGYLTADGRPLVAPVWFIVDNGELVFDTGRESAKSRALARDSRLVSCVDDPHRPYSFMQAQGTRGAGPADQGQLGVQYRRLTRRASTRLRRCNGIRARLWRCNGFRLARR
jgi:PPOX class probable F420-dependent enzyme